MKIKKQKSFTNFARIFLSLAISLYCLAIIDDTYANLDITLEIFIGFLLFLLINNAAKFIPIEDIIAKL